MMRRSLLVCALPLVSFGALAACHPRSAAPESGDTPDAAPYVARFQPIDSDGHVLRDARGRTVILRGYNVKVRGLFDVTPDNGQPVREPIPALDDTDLALMAKSGVNVLRLPINWSAYEPRRGQFVAPYLDAVAAFLDRVGRYGFFVILDFHEDGWSKDICEDGAPAWATIVTGAREGGLSADCHVSNAALSAHSHFFDDNTDDLQGAYAAMAQNVAARFAADDRVLGYELFNEPIASDAIVDAFSITIAQAIRQMDSRHLILWEPSAFRVQFNRAYVSSTPFPVDGCVYAVHIYATDDDLLTSSIQQARAEADGWGEPLFVTEHGGTPDADGGLAWVDHALDGYDQTMASSTDWIWNPGVVTRDDAGALDYLLDGAVYDHLTRPYAMAIGGDALATIWDGATLTVTFRGHTGVPALHDVYWNRGTPAVTCDGVDAISPQADSRLVFQVTCGGADVAEHTLVFSAAPATSR